MLRAFITLTILLSSITLTANTMEMSSPQIRFLNITGTIKDENNKALDNVTIKTLLQNAENNITTKTEIKSNAAGKYEVHADQPGKMTVVFSKDGYLPFNIEINISQSSYLQLQIKGTPIQQEVRLNKRTEKLPVDIYNGCKISFNPTERAFTATPLKRYLQAYQIKFSKGLKTPEKLVKKINNSLEDGELKIFLANIASHDDVKAIVANTTNTLDAEKWTIFFELNKPEEFVKRFENNQDAFLNITKLLNDEEVKFDIVSFKTNEKKSTIIDPTHTHFITYTLTIKNNKNEIKKYDFYFANTLNGWKLHRFITENYE
ncbi:hypothetical protein DNU06_13185 [Putridiphycobacter roseus]|uniref:Carboxypeptidase regulatory-like domain-containing protein n=1 Tax=Putridiphycobacter roseus TaxID=2219161 RepID=A0A2W1MYM9_9FLAO|nr:carboxypeptidase-like regulatory domain-containing protein [Putridiphycobacter roseus]PZE16494.1 hypothetical protein DNU06_13185 [Putridiphycobacter roseus]